ILGRGILNVAVRLLSHLIETVGRIASVRIIGQLRAAERKWTITQFVEVHNSSIRVGSDESLRKLTGCAGGEEMEIFCFQRGLNGCQKTEWRARRKDRFCRRKVQRRNRQFLKGSLLAAVQADEKLSAKRGNSLELPRLSKIRSGSSIGLDDSLR